MNHEIVKDYLGHPCRFTEAKTRFSSPLQDAQKFERRELKRRVGALLLKLDDRIDHAHNASSALRDMACSIDEDSQLHALLVMFSDYQLQTINMFYDFTGHVLAGFEDATATTAGRA